MFGRELAPINEAAMRTLRAAIVSCLTFVTNRRSVDLTFSAATQGNDVDPDITVVCRRAAAARRAMAKDKQAKKLMKDIFFKYKEKGEPGIRKRGQDLSQKELAGDPTSPKRAQMRRKCNPHGPIG